MTKKCNKFETLFTFADKKTLLEHIAQCEDCRKEYEKMNKRKKNKTEKRLDLVKELSRYNYVIEDYDGEEWKPIKNFDGYQISNYGRVKHYAKRYNAYHLLTPCLSELHNRYYVSMVNNDGKTKNIQTNITSAHAE